MAKIKILHVFALMVFSSTTQGMGDNVPSYGNDLETDDDNDWLDFVGERPAALPKDKAWKAKSLQDSKFDPCDTAVVLIDQYRRSVNYTAGDAGEDQDKGEWVNDYYLETGWYKFPGPQGDNMPTFPPTNGKCGALYPIWLDDELPSTDDGEVNAKACTMGGPTMNCSQMYNIKIKNCLDQYYVYYLEQAKGDNQAYCIGEEIKCPDGEASETGFTPGCINGEFVTLINDPFIDFRSHTPEPSECPGGSCFMYPREIVARCNIEHNETDIFLDVVWHIGNTMIKEVKGLDYNTATDDSELMEHEWNQQFKLPNTVKCKVRARYTVDGLPGPERQASFDMKFTLVKVYLEVEEGGQPDYVIVKPTVPILCQVGQDDCLLSIEVIEPEASEAACPNGRHLKQTALQTAVPQCHLSIPMTQTIVIGVTNFTLPVYGAKDNVWDGDQEVLLKLRTIESHIAHPIWQNYELPDITVSVRDNDPVIEGKRCRVHDDPHFVTFDGSPYDVMLEGEFILYRHKTLNVEIQAFFRHPEGKSYTQICGAAVRSGEDLYIYDHCRAADGKEIRQRQYECGDLEIRVEQSDSSTKLYLPHGTEVILKPKEILIYPSLADFEAVEGLCGNFDNVCGNDFVGQDGSVFDDPCDPDPSCSDVGKCPMHREMHDFAKTWCVCPDCQCQEGSDSCCDASLYTGNINDYDPDPSKTFYCTCEKDPQSGELITECGSDDTRLCGESTSPDGDQSQCNSRRKAMMTNTGSDDVVDEVVMFSYDPTYESPVANWTDGWNEVTARASCRTYFERMSAFEKCSNLPTVNTELNIEACVSDIKILSSEEFHIVHASSILTVCLQEISKNMSLFTFTNASVEPPKDMVADICPSNCNFQGDCVEGVCQCYGDYFGDDCFLDSNKVPTLFGIPYDGMCDTLSRPCEQTPVTGNYFLRKPTLTCHIQPVLITVSGDKIPLETELLTAAFDHIQRVMCPLPLVSISEEQEVLTIGYIVAVSNDGKNHSDTRNVTSYNSVCMNCSSDMNCFLKDDTCFVSGTCYMDGQSSDNLSCMQCNGQTGVLEQDPMTCLIENACYADGHISTTEPCRHCDPNNNNVGWSEVPGCESNTGLIVGSVIMLVGVVGGSVVGSFIAVKKINRNKSRKLSSTINVNKEGNTDNFNELTAIDA